MQFATGDQFYDRKELLADLRSRFLSGSASVVLYGPRRYGKSSLVRMLVAELESAGIPCVVLDVVKVPSIDLFLSSYATKVSRRFAAAGLSIAGEAARDLVSRIGNIPCYVQQLGFETFRFVAEDSRSLATPADVAAAFDRLAGFNRDQYEQQMLAFSPAQKRLLAALAREPAPRIGEAYRARHGLGVPSTVQSAKKKLLDDDILEQTDGQCVIADPFFAEFLRHA